VLQFRHRPGAKLLCAEIFLRSSKVFLAVSLVSVAIYIAPIGILACARGWAALDFTKEQHDF
jgi:hypothetical protein